VPLVHYVRVADDTNHLVGVASTLGKHDDFQSQDQRQGGSQKIEVKNPIKHIHNGQDDLGTG
jgi:hypothetical protein